MQKLNFSRNELPFFGKLVDLLDSNQNELLPLIQQPFSIENFRKQMVLKQDFPKERRATLVEVIEHQYADAKLELPLQVRELLNENTFTVCTGHQLNLFTGPFYTIYKIVHVIQLAEQLQKNYPEHQFVPIFWLATEDHDFEEINHFHVDNQKVKWNTNHGGAVGRMPLENWTSWQEEVLALFPNNHLLINKLLEAYQGKDLAQATFKLYEFLFRDTHLIILNGDDKTLKRSFLPVMEKEVSEQFALKGTLQSSEILREKSIKEQAFAREINLFHLEEGSRTRLESNAAGNITINKQTCTKEQVLAMLREHPEDFSPNVILRPVYQEFVLPNLCYVGGSGELAYWLQLKPVFDTAKVVYPLLQLRFSMQIINKKQHDKMHKLGFEFPHFSNKLDVVLREYNKLQTSRKDTLACVNEQLEQLERILVDQAAQVDTTLIPAAHAEMQAIKKSIQRFEIKLTRNERKKNSSGLQRVEHLHQTLFPNNALQERHANFLPYYLESGGALVPMLLDQIDVVKDSYILLVLEN
jgi:bacillithiol biosynthesis cysteine-adding enzyme BshC